MASLDRITARLQADLARANHRASRLMRPGIVEEYDPEKHVARVRLGGTDEEPFLSPWCRILESSGGQTSRTTLTKLQNVWLMCPDGDLRGARIMAGDFSDQFKSSSSSGEETRFERGDVRIALRPDEAEMSFGETTVRVKEGKLSVHTTGTAEFT